MNTEALNNVLVYFGKFIRIIIYFMIAIQKEKCAEKCYDPGCTMMYVMCPSYKQKRSKCSVFHNLYKDL
jgi:hypothetical protein